MRPSTPTPGQLLRDPLLLLAFGFGSGLSPKAPGTAGTLVAVGLFPLLALLPLSLYLSMLLVVVIAGVGICGYAARKMGVHDHGGIVWDELAGFWLAMTAFPATWPWLLAGFVLFRFFDIVKPWPISWLDRNVTGGLGIMLDDLVAGALTWGVLTLIAMTGLMV